jgi:hypothetical protein
MLTMRRLVFAAFVLLLACAGCALDRGLRPGPDGASSYGAYGSENGYDVWTFYHSLEPYGDWFQHPSYGWVWSPHVRSSAWRPYVDGRWVDSEHGWTWSSNEPWGWAAYHYGRWTHDDQGGWLWVPGVEWAGSWVAWRYSRSWIGWSPLPPDARWTAEWGLEGYDSTQTRPSEWVFVQRQRLFDHDLNATVVPVTRNAAILEGTRDATRFDARGGRPYARGIDRATVEKMTARKPPRVVIVDADSPAEGRGEVQEGRMELYRPTLRDSTRSTPRGANEDSLEAAPAKSLAPAKSVAPERRAPPAKSSPQRPQGSSSPRTSRPAATGSP